jgi:sulfane dehydrogenase subunit SoxC
MTRSVPLAKAMNDVLLAYGQNGEAIRPEQGYPLRLFVPGWEGNISIKWLRRIKVVDQPYMTREETSKYTDLMPDGKARQFTFEMDPKSLITYPSGGQKLSSPGFYEISGLAWSGRGAIRKVEVSVDGGRSWQDAQLQSPVIPIAFTRFRFGWKWDGSEVVLQSRCTDEHGDVQPALADLVKARGDHWSYHFNPIQSWKVAADGSVQNALV